MSDFLTRILFFLFKDGSQPIYIRIYQNCNKDSHKGFKDSGKDIQDSIFRPNGQGNNQHGRYSANDSRLVVHSDIGHDCQHSTDRHQKEGDPILLLKDTIDNEKEQSVKTTDAVS